MEISGTEAEGYSRPVIKTNQTPEVAVTNPSRHNLNQLESIKKTALTAKKTTNPSQLSIGARSEMKSRPGHNMNVN